MKKCSFCGSTEIDAYKMFSNGDIHICDSCVADFSEEISESFLSEFKDLFGEPAYKKKDNTSKQNLPSIQKPKDIKAFLDNYVIGQEEAKVSMAIAVYNHYKRINNIGSNKDIEINKSNILMVGSSGVGKTELARSIAKMLNVPFAIADATTLTEAGYVGDDVENILLKLIQIADYDVDLAEQGIIYIDEIDKISRKSENVSITRDVAGEGVQHALLKIIEGTVARVPPQGGRKHPHEECIEIDTSNILFICGGAFDGISKIIEKRMNKDKNKIGFNSEIHSTKEETNYLQYIEPEDFIKYGLVPELVGRLPIITTLNDLSKDNLLHILTEPKNAIVKQYQELFAIDGVRLEFDNTALEAIVDKAIEKKLGARGLRAIIEKSMKQVMFDVPSMDNISKVIITANVINNCGQPILYNNKMKQIGA